MSSARVITDVAELVGEVELTRVVTYAVIGTRHEEGVEVAEAQDLRVAVRDAERGFETRFRLSQTTPEAELVADVGAFFTLDSALKASPEAMREFVERVGIMTTFPYLRESLSTTATRLGVPVPILALLRQGQVTVELDPHSPSTAVTNSSAD